MSGIFLAAGQGVPFGVTIGPGGVSSGSLTSHTFGANTVTVVGGVGPFTYLWTETDDATGTWSILNGTTASASARVTGLASGLDSQCSLSCQVTDTGTGKVVTAPTTPVYHYFCI